MILPVLGLLVGVAVGMLSPITVPLAYAKLSSVALLASLDSVFGGLRAASENHFNNAVFISGFFMNALMAYIGDRLGIDLYYVALLAFGLRVFQNLAILRRHFFEKHN